MTELIDTLKEIQKSKMSLRELLIENMIETINADNEKWAWARNYEPAASLPDFSVMSDYELLLEFKKSAQKACVPMG